MLPLHHRRRRAAADLAMVAASMREVSRSERPRDTIGRAMCELTGAAMSGLLEPDGRGNLVLTGAHGLDAPITLSLDERSASGTTFLTREHLFVSDLANGPAVAALARRYGVASAMYEPVVVGEQAVGVLFVAWERRVKRLEDRAVSVARLFAGEAALMIERAGLTARLEHVARTDELTGLPNRRTADDELGRCLSRARRSGEPLSVAMIGVAPDTRLLQAAGRAWKDALRAGDLLARYGDDTFLALLPACGLDDAGDAAERLHAALECSVGVVLWNRGESGPELLSRAGAALDKARAGGRDRVVVARETTYVT